MMEKRSSDRIPANVDITFRSNGDEYNGTIINISESGMFITTKEMNSPFDSEFEIVIPLEENTLQVPVNLSRFILSPDSEDGLGVELSNHSPEYLNFVSSLKSHIKS
jgi:hypothetical protein